MYLSMYVCIYVCMYVSRWCRWGEVEWGDRVGEVEWLFVCLSICLLSHFPLPSPSKKKKNKDFILIREEEGRSHGMCNGDFRDCLF